MIANHPLALWLAFGAMVGLLLLVDLGGTRRPQVATIRSAAWWTVTVVSMAVLFDIVVLLAGNRTQAIQFASGYVVELSLSVDNLLVFILVLRYFAVPEALQPTVLKWGILGAIVMRGAMIATGSVLIGRFRWVIYLLGALLVFTGAKLLVQSEEPDVDPANNRVTRALRRVLPLTDQFHGGAFVIRRDGRWLATPLLLVLLVIEWTDLVFATDSIPAIFAVTRDPFLVYTSNILAVVGLRALYFLLAGILDRLTFLRFGVATVLVLIGLKMLLGQWVYISPEVLLGTIVAILGVSVPASKLRREQ